MWWRINKWVFLLLMLIFAVTFQMRKGYRAVDDISPELYKQPVQAPVTSKEEIKFDSGGYSYTLTPLFYYEINALIVHAKDYSWFTIYQKNKTLQYDLCLIWGGNVASKVYQDKGLQFAQDSRFCSARWQPGMSFSMNEASNNHLLASDKRVIGKLNSITTGDQIKLRGRLVNLQAMKEKSTDGEYDPTFFQMKTSTIRTDGGDGACEVIYVDDLVVLKRGHPFVNLLFKFSILGLAALLLVNVARLLKGFFVTPKY